METRRLKKRQQEVEAKVLNENAKSNEDKNKMSQSNSKKTLKKLDTVYFHHYFICKLYMKMFNAIFQ